MNKRAILAVFAVVSVGVAATPAAAQDDCYRCETTYYANGAFHEVKVDPTVLLTTDGPAPRLDFRNVRGAPARARGVLLASFGRSGG